MATTGQTASSLGLGEKDWPPSPVSEADLARGMLLLRASNMNVVRLQLAMERRDRRLAMEALDGLVALDGELSGLIGDMPPPGAEYSALARRLDDQKVALASEKLVFAAGRAGPALARASSAPAYTEIPSPPAPEEAEFFAEEDEKPARGARWIALAATILLLLALGAAGAYYALGIDGVTKIVEAWR